jgi:hypothetical protein
MLQVDGKDEFAYCGTSTGDILKIRLNLPSRDGFRCDKQDRLGPPASGPTLNCIIGRKQLKIEKGRNNHLYKGGKAL